MHKNINGDCLIYFIDTSDMKTEDTYKTIKSVSRGIYKEKGSRFIAYALPVTSVDEIKSILDGYRKKYHDARHHCYAYMIGFERTDWRAKTKIN